MTVEYPASKLKRMALHWLRRQYPRALLTTELALGQWGSASVDVAAIDVGDDHHLYASEIIGVEVKGDGDTAARLARQGHTYARAATRMWLLTAPSVQKKCLREIPEGWRWLEIHGSDEIKPGGVARAVPPVVLPNSPTALAGLLWKREAVAAAKRLRLPGNPKRSAHDLAELIGETAPLKDVREIVVRALYERDWGGGNVPKTVWRPDDKLPTLDATEAAA